MTLPSSSILLFWLHITLSLEAVSHSAAASMLAFTLLLEQSNVLKQRENALIRRACQRSDGFAYSVLFSFADSKILAARCHTVKAAVAKVESLWFGPSMWLHWFKNCSEDQWDPLPSVYKHTPPASYLGGSKAKESNGLVIIKKCSPFFLPREHRNAPYIHFLFRTLRMVALLLLVSRHLSTSICLAKTIRYLCHVN